MQADHFDPEIHQVVRRYSLIVAEENPNDTLSQALGATAQHEIAQEQRRREWQDWLQFQGPCRDQSMDRLEQSMDRLEKAKKQVADRWKQLNSKLKLGDTVNDGDGPPRIDTMFQDVQWAQAKRTMKQQSKFGQTKAVMESFLSTMNDHSNLFSVIPNGDKYISLITGVVTSVVKATVNHIKTAELFSENLTDIAQDLRTVPNSIKISNSTQMKILVVNLYVAVFDFLCTAVDWYGSRMNRFKAAINQSYPDIIKKQVANVKSALSRIKHEAEQVTQETVLGIAQALENMQQKMEQKIEMLENSGRKSRESEVSQGEQLNAVLEQLGQKTVLSLLATGQAHNHDQRPVAIKRQRAIEGGTSSTQERISDGDADLYTIPEGVPDGRPFEYTRDEIGERAASYLKPFLEDGRSEVLKTISTISPNCLPAEVTQKINTWIGDPSSKFLWIEGPVYIAAERQLSITALRICDAALSASNPVPCISFTPMLRSTFQPLSDPSRPSTMTRQEKVLIALLYCLAGQLLYLLPDTLESTTDDFGAAAFEKLDASFASASAAMDMIQSLLAHSPPTLIVIIDKLQQAEDRATAPILERLVAVLRDRAAPGQIIKALFVTNGSSRFLSKSLDLKTEKVDARRMVQARPGRPLRGWQSVSNLSMPGQDQ